MPSERSEGKYRSKQGRCMTTKIKIHSVEEGDNRKKINTFEKLG